jgi:hypothetical protein
MPNGGGLYCVALLVPTTGTFRHYFHSDLAVASRQIETLDAQGQTVYLAQATYDRTKIEAAQKFNAAKSRETKRAKERSQDNAISLKNFFLDIDCGEKWPLKDQREGAAALKDFIQETKLPMPTVVNSGNGLYAHWILSEAIPARQWQTVAKVLKHVVAAYSPAIGGDASRTSDSASVLRPPGTTNRKPGRPEKPVRLVHEAEEVHFLQFAQLLGAAARKRQINRTALIAPKASTDVNADFLVRQDSVPVDPVKVAEECNQLATMRSSLGDVVEPLWYACIGVLAYCEDGEAAAHEWSAGHVDYSHGQTAGKIQQWLDAGVGPTTCAKFGEVNPNGCIGCRHNGNIKSPIVLGRPAPKAIVIPDLQCPTPAGFRRSEEGLFVERDGRWIKFYDRDLWLHQLAYDESLGYEVMVVRHSLPYEGEVECSLRSSIVNDPKALMIGLSDNHIKVVGQEAKKVMVGYIESYQQVLQRNRRMTRLLCQMGWKEEGRMFVLGKKIFHKDGSIEDASLAKGVPRAAEGFRSKGSLAAWSKQTRHLGRAGMEPLAFALLAGGFGAPLMRFTGFDGALVSMVGASGVGKTLLLRWIASVWGYHSDLIMLRDDTANAVMSRLGVYGTLPMVIDEMTNSTGMEVSNNVYRITQGRDKNRLTKNAEEKKFVNQWNTLAVTSSNASLVDLLSSVKQDASAEINRIFEFPVTEHRDFRGSVTTDIYWTLDDNYGLAGEVYAAWLVQNTDKIKPALDEVRTKLEKAANLKGEERFWGAIAAVAIVGGLFARKLGLIEFEVTPVYNWMVKVITTMRTDKIDTTGDAIDILGQFLDEHAHNRLVVTKGKGTREIVLDEPRGKLDVRVEADERAALFIGRNEMKQWVGKRFGSYTKFKTELVARGVLMDANYKKCLGAGTTYAGVMQPCWKLDLDAEALGERGRELREGAAILQPNEDALFK